MYAATALSRGIVTQQTNAARLDARTTGSGNAASSAAACASRPPRAIARSAIVTAARAWIGAIPRPVAHRTSPSAASPGTRPEGVAANAARAASTHRGSWRASAAGQATPWPGRGAVWNGSGLMASISSFGSTGPAVPIGSDRTIGH